MFIWAHCVFCPRLQAQDTEEPFTVKDPVKPNGIEPAVGTVHQTPTNMQGQ